MTKLIIKFWEGAKSEVDIGNEPLEWVKGICFFVLKEFCYVVLVNWFRRMVKLNTEDSCFLS